MEEIDIKKLVIIIILVVGVLSIGLFIYSRNRMKEEKYEYENIIAVDNSVENLSKKEELSTNYIVVHVTGAVKNPGIVKIREGSRIQDAINEAGGGTEKINLNQINLAYLLEDGQKIYIPSIDDKEVNQEDQILEKEYITTEAGDSVIVEEETSNKKVGTNSQTSTSTSKKININTNNIEDLNQIPGVGEATANKILEYRKSNGKFKTIEDIKNVSGIGEAKFEKMKDYIVAK